MKRLICLLLCITSLIPLTSCNILRTKHKEEIYYEGRKLDLDVSILDSLYSTNELHLWDGKLYFLRYKYDDNMTPDIQPDDYTFDANGNIDMLPIYIKNVDYFSSKITTLCRTNIDGSGFEELSDFVDSQLPNGERGIVNTTILAVSDNGDIWLSIETIEVKNEETFRNVFIAVLDESGREANRVNLSELYFIYNGNPVTIGAVDKDGNLCTTDGERIYVINSSLDRVFTAEVEVDAIVTSGSGELLIINTGGLTGTEMTIWRVDTAAKLLDNKTVFRRNVGSVNIFDGSGEAAFYYASAGKLFEFDLVSETSRAVISFIDNEDLSGATLQKMVRLTAESLLCLFTTFDNTGSSSQPVVETAAYHYEQKVRLIEDKTVLTIAVASRIPVNSKLPVNIDAFNRSHSDVKIELKDYYTLDDDYVVEIDRLIIDILAGDVPDMVYFSESYSYDRFGFGHGDVYNALTKHDLLVDLYTYLDNDPDLSREDFIPKALEAMEYNGMLVCAAKRFSIETYIAKSENVSTTLNFTIEDMLKALDEMPEGALIFAGMTKKDILHDALCYNVMYDKESLKCNFDSEEFIDLLHFVQDCPSGREDLRVLGWGLSEENINRRTTLNDLFIHDEVLLREHFVESISQIPFDSYTFTCDPSYVGFPNDNNYGSRVIIDFSIAMTTECKDKEAAWDFIKNQSFIFEDPTAFNVITESDRFPSNIHTMNAWLKQINSGNLKRTFPNGEPYLHPLTPEETDYLWDVINNSSTYRLDSKTWAIVSDETDYFFAGERSAEETARVIQSRVEIYLSEQYG